jgi:hypothetical protein
MPAIYPEREYADDGGFLAYGQDIPDWFRRAATYVSGERVRVRSALGTAFPASSTVANMTLRWREMDSNFRFRCVRRS